MKCIYKIYFIRRNTYSKKYFSTLFLFYNDNDVIMAYIVQSIIFCKTGIYDKKQHSKSYYFSLLIRFISYNSVITNQWNKVQAIQLNIWYIQLPLKTHVNATFLNLLVFLNQNDPESVLVFCVFGIIEKVLVGCLFLLVLFYRVFRHEFSACFISIRKSIAAPNIDITRSSCNTAAFRIKWHTETTKTTTTENWYCV